MQKFENQVTDKTLFDDLYKNFGKTSLITECVLVSRESLKSIRQFYRNLLEKFIPKL